MRSKLIKTNGDLLVCGCFEFWLVHCIVFIELSASAVIGSDYFGFGFMTLHVNSTPQVGRGGGGGGGVWVGVCCQELFLWPWLRVQPKFNTFLKIKNIRISFLKRWHSKELWENWISTWEKQLKSKTRHKRDSDDSRQEIDNVYK